MMALNQPELIQSLVDHAHRGHGPHRIRHILGVTHTACTLAALHGLGVERAAAAGLLHDLFKGVSPPQILADLEVAGRSIPPEDLDHPKTWHGLRAAVYAEVELGLTDPDVLEAAALHTTADAGICPLTRVLFIADYCEPGRHIEQTDEILQVARRDLDEGFRQALLTKTAYIRSKKNRSMHPRAIRALRAWLPEGDWEELVEAAI